MELPKGSWFACSSGLTPYISPLLCHHLPSSASWSNSFPKGTLILAKERGVSQPFLLLPQARDCTHSSFLTSKSQNGRSSCCVDQSPHQGGAKFPGSGESDRPGLGYPRKIQEPSLTSFLNSLAEEALQNRTGLGFPFLQQGGLCVALGEQYYFYTNHTGAIKETLSLVRKRLRQRVQTRSARQGWLESPFSGSS